MNSIAELEGATKTYRRGSETIAAVSNVSMRIDSGEFVAITGPSGSGKSTLLNLIGCVDRPDSGVIRINGMTTSALSERQLTRVRAQQIGFVFQQFFLIPTLTVRENVLLPLVFSGRRDDARADALIARVGLTDRAKHRPAQLSGGEMQRVAIARALIHEPAILLADEPTGSLDSTTAASILDLFLELHREGLTIAMVTHNQELASQAHRAVHIRDGRIARDEFLARTG